MNLFTADLNALSIADLEDFLAIKSAEEQRPAEGVKIDYKLKEPSDFPETVAAFANTAGGLVFIGVESKKLKHNVPVGLPGETFVGGDIRARITGKIISQVTPRPEFSVGVVPVAGRPGVAVVVVRVPEGRWPPYEFSETNRTRIPVRIEDTVRQATLREIEQLFSKRESQSQTASERISGAFDETKPLNPAFIVQFEQPPIPSHAYQTWTAHPRQPLHLILDRDFEESTRRGIVSRFKGMVPLQEFPPSISAGSHTFKWQGRTSGDSETLTFVRYFEITAEGSIRYSEKIDRHDAGVESVSDLYIGSIQFLNFLAAFYHHHGYFGGVSAAQRIDCPVDGIQLSSTFPDIEGHYSNTSALSFRGQEHGNARGSSGVVREVNSLEGGDRIRIVHEFLLQNLRQLCQVSIDSKDLLPVLNNLPERAPFPRT